MTGTPPHRRLVGTGPLTLAVVAIAAVPYLAACDLGPTADGQLDVVQVCASRTVEPMRLPDERCDGAGTPGAEWVYANLPPSPVAEVPQTCYDEDGYSYDCPTTDIDTDAGGAYIGPVYAPLRPRGTPATTPVLWSTSTPPGDPARIGRGVAPGGGTLTRSGAGTGGWNAPGSKIATRTGGLTRQPSPSISRGGLGASSSNVSGAGSGPRGGSSGGSSGG